MRIGPHRRLLVGAGYLPYSPFHGSRKKTWQGWAATRAVGQATQVRHRAPLNLQPRVGQQRRDRVKGEQSDPNMSPGKKRQMIGKRRIERPLRATVRNGWQGRDDGSAQGTAEKNHAQTACTSLAKTEASLTRCSHAAASRARCTAAVRGGERRGARTGCAKGPAPGTPSPRRGRGAVSAREGPCQRGAPRPGAHLARAGQGAREEQWSAVARGWWWSLPWGLLVRAPSRHGAARARTRPRRVPRTSAGGGARAPMTPQRPRRASHGRALPRRSLRGSVHRGRQW